jgi:hypothetical protein
MKKRLHSPEIGELVISIVDTAEYIDAEGASCPGNRGIIYFHRRYCRIY